ncbi:MAG TPA: zinc ABC transporter substrate-binding protein [Candidatus Saccharimonadales bacterium]
MKQGIFRMFTIVALVAALAGGALALHSRRAAPTSDAVRVSATFYPMAEFVRQVGGRYVQVSTLVKPGVEPHDYDPTPQDIAGIYKSKVFVYNGAGLERWTDRLQGDLSANHVVSVNASNGIALHAKDASDTENTSSTDPHVWMDPTLAIKEVSNIRDGLIKADPAHAGAYRANAASYVTQLQALDQQFKTGLSHCQNHTIITSHQAFRYLAAQYGLDAIGIAGLSPDDEPSPQKLAEIASLARSRGADYIFFETLASPKLSQTIAHEVGAKTIAFNPLEGLTQSEIGAGKNYLTVQKDNLQGLETALHCTL